MIFRCRSLSPELSAGNWRAEDRAKLDRLLIDVGEELPASSAGATAAPGDWRRLRGVPAVGRGIGGTIAGTDPLRALLAKERR